MRDAGQTGEKGVIAGRYVGCEGTDILFERIFSLGCAGNSVLKEPAKT